MSDLVNCPSCGRELRVPPDLMGQAVRCPTCGNTFTTQTAAPQGSPEPAVAHAQPTAFHSPEHSLPLQRDRGTLILVLGILSIAVGCECVGLVLGPLAWIMGSGDLREIRAGRMDPRGESNTNAGRICGIIGTILSALACCGWGGIFGLGRAHRFG